MDYKRCLRAFYVRDYNLAAQISEIGNRLIVLASMKNHTKKPYISPADLNDLDCIIDELVGVIDMLHPEKPANESPWKAVIPAKDLESMIAPRKEGAT